jgi:hypothetical protein
MDVREKLVELLRNAKAAMKAESLSCDLAKNMFVVDFLMANGVTVQELDGCDFCKNFDFAGARAEVNKYGAHISLAICNTKSPDEERFKFCPMCGRRLSQPPKGE